MKTQTPQKIIATLLSLALPMLAGAANVTLTASDASGTTSLSTVGKWGADSTGYPALAPQPTNDYFTGPYFVRTPTGTAGVTFAGHSLTLQNVVGGGQGTPNRSILYKGGGGDTITINNLTNAAGGVLNNGGSGVVTATFTGNLWTIAGNSTILSDQGPTVIGYPLYGSAVLTNDSGQARTITYNGNLSGFTGKFHIRNNLTVELGSTAGNLGNPASFTQDQISIGEANNTTLLVDSGVQFTNSNGGITLNGSAQTVNFNIAGSAVFSEPITDQTNAGAHSFTLFGKNGSGTMILSNTSSSHPNDWQGGTLISSGTLQIGYPGSLPPTNVTVNGSLDLNGISTTVVNLNGSGTVDTTATGGTPTLTVIGGGTFSGVLQNSVGTLSVTLLGPQTTTFSGGYNYSGQTLVAGGTLSLVTAGTLPNTPGDMILSNGAAIFVDASSGNPLPVKNLVIGTNSTVSLNVNAAASAINVAGNLTLQDNATNVFSYGTIAANPTAPAINVAGSLAAPGTNVIITIAATGLQPGTFALIKYTGTALSGIANFQVSPPPGVAAALVNNAGNHSIDLHVTAIPNQLVWNGVNGTAWDLATPNWTNPVAGGITVFRQYTNNGVVAGDAVTFDDTLTNNSPQPTNILLNSTFYAFPVVVNSTLPYTLAGAGGITGVTSLVKSNTGSLTMLVSNSFTGGVSIGGGTLVITNDSALGASSGAITMNNGILQINGNSTDSRAISIPVTSSIDVATNVTAQFTGAFTGAGGLMKTDAGTLTLAGSNGIAGTLEVDQGKLTASGTNILAAVPLVGNVAGNNAQLSLTGGLLQANNNGGNTYNTSLTIGNVSGAGGDMTMTAGTLTVNRQLTVGPTGYGAFTQSGGAATIGGFIAVGGNASGGVFNQTGGTVNMTGSSATIGYSAGSTYGVMNLSGSAVFNVTGAGNGVWPGEVGNGTLNVSGNAALTITNAGLLFGSATATTTTGVGTANLLGGVTTVNSVGKAAGGASSTLNFNGGTLKANLATNAFINGLTSANIYGGGAVIDDGGFAITIPQPLLGVSGLGVATIPVTPSTSSGYIDTPIVTISGGTGSNAMATASVSGGQVTAITITCPGSGYLSSDSLTVTFTGGGANPIPPSVGTITFAANGAGALTKKGAGTTTLTGLSTFTGPITNLAGTLLLNNTNTYSGAVSVNGGTLALNTATHLLGNITVSNGATLGVSQIAANLATIGNLTLGVAAAPAAILNLTLASGNTVTPFLNCGTLTLNGSNNVSLAGRFTIGSFPIIKYSGALAGSGTLTNVTLPQGDSGYISNSAANSTIYAVVTSTGSGLVWTGTNSVSPNLWDLGTTTNWLIANTPTTYQQTIPPGDPVTFNDVGSGTVILNVTADPFSLVISNTARPYTFQGLGSISGTTGILKYGANTAFFNLTNDSYTGSTIISNGTLQVGSSSALSPFGSLLVGAGGTLELAGFSSVVGELTGAGVIDNNGGLNPVLTVGGSSGGTWNGTIQDHGGGGVALHKVGSGTWVVAGTNSLNDGQPFTDQSMISAGTVVITNNALFEVSILQLQIGNLAGSAANVVVAGGTLAVSNNLLSVGYGNNTAVGTLTVNSGTLFHGGTAAGAGFSPVANSIDVGAQGATGTLVVNGGQVLNNQVLYLGDGAGASGTLQLNGGLLQAIQLLPNASPAASVAYFNGGTLQAVTNSSDFIDPTTTAYIQAGGLTLDDNGWALNIAQSLISDPSSTGGGLIKTGAGAVYLDVVQQYAGTTLVNNGLLAGVGGLTGPLMVGPAGNVGVGDAGPGESLFTVNNSVTLQGNATMRVAVTSASASQDQLTVNGNINYGGVLTITNVTSDSTPLSTSYTFPLFNVSGSKSGNFTGIVGSPGPGLAYHFNPANGTLSIITQTYVDWPTNLTFKVTGNVLSIGWPQDHEGWILQAQTNSLGSGLAPAGGAWVDIAASTGSTNFNITIDPANPTVFYRQRHP